MSLDARSRLSVSLLRLVLAGCHGDEGYDCDSLAAFIDEFDDATSRGAGDSDSTDADTDSTGDGDGDTTTGDGDGDACGGGGPGCYPDSTNSAAGLSSRAPLGCGSGSFTSPWVVDIAGGGAIDAAK